MDIVVNFSTDEKVVFPDSDYDIDDAGVLYISQSYRDEYEEIQWRIVAAYSPAAWAGLRFVDVPVNVQNPNDPEDRKVI